jgi:hypothetical protein
MDVCEVASDCVLEALGCCGLCEPAELELFKGVNVKFAEESRRVEAAECGNVLCGQCIHGVPVSQNYAAVCQENRCVPVDVRAGEEFSACVEDIDCRARAGAGCCTSCEADDWIAVSAEEDKLQQLLCGGEDVVCPACAVPLLPEIEARCLEGTCQIVQSNL